MLVREGDSLAALAYHSDRTGTPYLEVPDPSWPNGHPRQIFEPYLGRRRRVRSVPRRFADAATVRMGTAHAFHRGGAEKDRLHRYADPMGALNLAVMGDGERLHWHFDQTDFVTSIALRPSEAGGDFEYVPLIRSAADENYPRVQRLLEGPERRGRARADASGDAAAVRRAQLDSSRHADQWTYDAIGRAARLRYQTGNAEQQRFAAGSLWPRRVGHRSGETRFASGLPRHLGLASRTTCWANWSSGDATLWNPDRQSVRLTT